MSAEREPLQLNGSLLPWFLAYLYILLSLRGAEVPGFFESGRSGDWRKELHGERDSRAASDLRAEVPLAGLSCPANAAGNNVTSVSLAVNPGPPQLVFIWIFVLEKS